MSRYWSDPANDPPLWLVALYILTPVMVIAGVIAFVAWWVLR